MYIIIQNNTGTVYSHVKFYIEDEQVYSAEGDTLDFIYTF